jgi:dipeptidyl aminopeptidase/acylaminoacyl peptidase
MSRTTPYGSWQSPIDAAAVAASETPLESVQIVGQAVYWSERRPREGGRSVIMCHNGSEAHLELTPPQFNVRTRVHEYGGGAFIVHESTIYFSNFDDQRLYRQDVDRTIRPITPEPGIPSGARYADTRVTNDGKLLFCVREVHSVDGEQPVNDVVVIPTDGSRPPKTVVSGHDFFAAPRISPNGRRLAWIAWDQPLMPWDGCELWVGDLAEDGSVLGPRRVAGGPDESIFQPNWSPRGELQFVSDRTGWWNIYRLDDNVTTALAPKDAEFGVPHWTFGLSTYAFLSDGRIATVFSSGGFDQLAFVSPDGELTVAELPYTAHVPSSLSASGDSLAFIAASPTEAAAVIRMNATSGQREVLRSSSELAIEPSHVSRPQAIAYPTKHAGQESYALYYPPNNPGFVGPDNELPPLIVKSHGGPTAMAQAQLNAEIQYFTSRGFAVVDVNYGGSSGFGRLYRQRLKGKWGLVDTDDCISAAQYLAAQGLADKERLVIRGGSAGGYTTLCALVFHDEFATGASYYGVADCETLATDTHKFESHYLDGLMGPYPQDRGVYRQRSPIHYAEQLSCPVILFQGLEDHVVPPSQAETMVDALRAKHLPFAYLTFAGEQHGFRKAETIKRSLEAELFFYSKILGFPLVDDIDPVDIENL